MSPEILPFWRYFAITNNWQLLLWWLELSAFSTQSGAKESKLGLRWPSLGCWWSTAHASWVEPSVSAGPSDQPPGQPLQSSRGSQLAKAASATGKGEVLSCSADCSVFEWLLPCAASQFLAHCSVLRRQPKQPPQPKFGPFRLGGLGRWR